MSPADLIARLEALAAPSPVAWFVLLATYYDAELTKAENALVHDNIHPLRVSEPPSFGVGPAELAVCFDELRGLAAGSAMFHRYALGLLRGLDRTLADVPSFALVPEVAIGCDGRAYRVRRLINPIADHAHLGLPPSARQGTLAAHARRMKLVPADTSADTLGGRSIECLDLQASEPAVYKRLLAARDKLCVMLAPLSGRIEYGSLTASVAKADSFVVLKDPRNEAELLRQVRAALDAASGARAALLVFPELALSPAMLAALREHLAAGVTNGYPILTVAGLCHAPLSGEQHVNEAVVVGPRGQELHRHRKLTAHVDGGGVRERTAAGFVLGVLETPCGNLATPICLDVFAVGTRALLEGSHATLLLVPSFSPKVSAHQAAAKAFGVQRWGSTFVCNRTLDGYHKGAESFYWAPRPDGKEPLTEHDGRTPCLSFSVLD